MVNSSKASEKLEYLQNHPMRVIAIGGLALSRGLTLEGLVVSYFYRNTCTYDVLMQMGRWFGYRKNYEDLFRIWIHKASADWYAEIADATEKLKEDMAIMRDLGKRPRDFGIRVRNDSDELSITAPNKMRNAKDEYEFESYFGDIVETPYLHFDTEANKKNFKATERLVNDLIKRGYKLERQKVKRGKGHYIIQEIPKAVIVEYIRSLDVSRYNSKFDARQIAEFLENTDEKCIDTFDLAFMEGASTNDDKLIVDMFGVKIPKVLRRKCIIDRESDRLGIGRRGKLSGLEDGIAGIVDCNGKTADEIIAEAKRLYRLEFMKKEGVEFKEGSSYPSNTWFTYVEDRRPILLIYLIDINVDKNETNQKKQVNEFREKMDGIPAVGLAMGLPKNNKYLSVSRKKYRANKTYNWFEKQEILAEGEEE